MRAFDGDNETNDRLFKFRQSKKSARTARFTEGMTDAADPRDMPATLVVPAFSRSAARVDIVTAYARFTLIVAPKQPQALVQCQPKHPRLIPEPRRDPDRSGRADGCKSTCTESKALNDKSPER